jgi:hypothetical protein
LYSKSPGWDSNRDEFKFKNKIGVFNIHGLLRAIGEYVNISGGIYGEKIMPN